MRKPFEPTHVQPTSRRRFLSLAGLGAGSLLLTSVLPTQRALAATPTPPKPQNNLTPEQALARLMAGNQRYVDGVTKRHDFLAEREALVSGQNPYAAVLSCADSRIAPEYAFDTARGDLFAVRVAGNFMTEDGLASLEYAVAVLGTPLILVVGHESCGAVSAAVKSLKDGARYPGKIQQLADAIKPSVEKALQQPGPLLDNAITQNVKDSMSNLQQQSAILQSAVAQGKLQILGGVYKMHSGKVEFII